MSEGLGLDLGVVLPGEWHILIDSVGFAGHCCETHRRIGVETYRCNDGHDGPNGGCSHVRIDACTCSPSPPCDGCLRWQQHRNARARRELGLES